MNVPLLESVLVRFTKGFIAGGIAQVLLIVGPGLSFHSLGDVKTVLTAVVFAFLTGGLLAIEKMAAHQ